MNPETIFCPECPPIFVKLIEIERNYSGCGVDIYKCPNCNSQFQISYKVDQILKI